MPETYTVRQLCEEVQGLVREAWGSVWVMGELQRPRASRAGHLYLELVEKGDGEAIVGKLDGVLWKGPYANVRRVLQGVGLELAEGVQIRCHGRLDFWPQGGRLQLVVDEIDPAFTEGRLERQRRETLEALAREGLLERNRQLPLPAVPLAVGLVASEGSAAYHDFLAVLAESGYPFRVLFVHAAVQGRGAEREIARALELLGRQALDCVALVRGGGSRTDLAVFDTRAVAEAVARCPLPVLSGLGHEIDLSIADRVAHTHQKTPTAVAELLAQRVAAAAARVAELAASLVRRTEQRLAAQHATLRVAESRLLASRSPLRHADERLRRLVAAVERAARGRLRTVRGRRRELARRLARRSVAAIERGRLRPPAVLAAVARAARGRLATAGARLEGWEKLVHGLAPERTLARGFSVTRGPDGTALRDAAAVPVGTRITTRLLHGELASRTEGA